MKRLIYLSFLLLLSFGVAYSATISGNVTGIVTGSEDVVPLEDVHVILMPDCHGPGGGGGHGYNGLGNEQLETLIALNQSSGSRDELVTETDENGDFVFEGVEIGEYMAVAHYGQWNFIIYDNAQSWEDATMIEVTDEAQEITGIDFLFNDVTEPGICDITGMVSDENTGEPLEEVSIMLYTPREDGFEVFYHAFTDENGEYTINNVSVGEYYCAAYKWEYMVQFYDHVGTEEEATMITVADGQEVVENITFDISRLEWGTISGEVESVDGEQIMGWVEILTADENQWLVGVAHIRENSTYTADMIPYGDYIIRAYDQNFTNERMYYDGVYTVDEATTVTVDASQPDVAGINFYFPYGSVEEVTFTVTGLVTDQFSQEPLEGAEIILWGPEGCWGPQGPEEDWVSTTSAEDGTYSFEITSSSGQYYAFANKPGYHEEFYLEADDFSQAELLRINPDNNTFTDINFTLMPYDNPGVISGNVTLPEEMPGHHADAIVEAILVDGDPDPDDPIISWGYVSNNGDYVIQDLGYSDYIIRCVPFSWWLQPEYYDDASQIEDATIITLNAENQVVENIDFEIESTGDGTGQISGVVKDLEGNPIADAPINLEGVNGPGGHNWRYYHTQTNEEGEFVLDLIIEGDYILSVPSYDYQPYYWENASNWQDADVITIEEETVMDDVEITLLPWVLYEVSGVVNDSETNAPLSGIQVLAVPNFWEGGPDGNGCHGEWHHFEGVAETNENGEYIIEVPEGDYTVMAYPMDDSYYLPQYYDHKDNWEDADLVEVTGDITDINFDLESFDPGNDDWFTISGVITIDGEVPQNSVRVVAVSSEEDQWDDVADEFGNFEIHVPAGNYYIFAEADGYARTFYNDVINFDDATRIDVGPDAINIDINMSSVLRPFSSLTLSGVVTDNNSTPIKNVVVVALNDYGQIIDYAYTSSTGTYSINNLVPGEFTILATKYFRSSDIEIMNIEQDASMDFVLTPFNNDLTNDFAVAPVKKMALDNYPNPFNPVTNIIYSLPEANNVKITIFNIKGQQVKELVNSYQAEGSYSVIWDGKDDNNCSVSSGVYFYRIESGAVAKTNKMVLMK